MSGRVVVAALAVTETISWGIIYYSFPVFLRAMERDLGASQVAVTGALSMALAVSALAAVPVGRWLDRYGPRTLMTAGSCLAAALLLSWSHVESLGALYVVWCLMGLAMASTLYEPAFAAIIQWFPRDRGRRDRALLAVTLVAGLASTIFMPLAAWLLGRFGWRTGAEILAVVLGITTIPIHALVLRPARHGFAPGARDMEPQGTEPRVAEPAPESLSLRAALGAPVFWALAVAFAVGSFAVVAITVHLIPYLMQRGYPPAYSAAVVGGIGAMQLVGRVLFAPIAARFGSLAAAGAIFLAQGAALAGLPAAGHPAGLLSVIALLGATGGMATLARATAVADIFGRRNYGSISGAIAVGANGARALGPVGASLLRVWLGGYDRVFWALAGAVALAGLGVLATGSRAGAAGTATRAGKRSRVLFVCTHNSARSQMAEGWLRHLAGDHFEARSAGTDATGVRPLAVRAMAEVGVDISRQRSKRLDEYLGQSFDVVITVCDDAAETCPVFPGGGRRLHWSLPDPSGATGAEEERLRVFREVRDRLRRLIVEFADPAELR